MDRKADLQFFGLLVFCFVFLLNLLFIVSTVFLPFAAFDSFIWSPEGSFHETFSQL